MTGRVYLSGPMTGYPDFNHPAFYAKADELKAKGFDVFNPAENGLSREHAWVEHMRVDIRALLECDGIYMMRGWIASKGACLELHIAKSLGMPVMFEAKS